MDVRTSYDEFVRWDYAEQKRLLRDHIPVRNHRKQLLQDDCNGVHCFRKATGYRALQLGLMQCIHCGVRTNDPSLIKASTTIVNQERIDKFKAFMRWNNETARKLLADHISLRKDRLALIQSQCNHNYVQRFSHKTRRKEMVCVHCKHKTESPRR
jgi:hypothetical protein